MNKKAVDRNVLRKLRSEPVGSLDAVKVPLVQRLLFFKQFGDEFARWTWDASEKLFGKPLWGKRTLLFHQPGDVLMIVPPFAALWWPSLAAHVLQACIRRAGFTVDVLYANMLLSSTIGETAYEQICAESIAMAGERFFARAAFGTPALGRMAEQMFDPIKIFGAEKGELYRQLYPDGRDAAQMDIKPISIKRLRKLESNIPEWVNKVSGQIADRGYKIVGCTTTFQQTCASVALLSRIKSLRPDIVTVMGGANCEGEMAEGLAAVCPNIDHIFSGESEDTFTEFVHAVLKGTRPSAKILYGRPCANMDALPTLSYKEYFEQRSSYMAFPGPPQHTYLTYETSRGCWWGQKQHCTFCGLNGEGMGFRRKSPERALDELRTILRENPTRNISMTDNIMPRDYFRTLLPLLQRELPGLNIFYEQKSNLTFNDVLALKQAGINTIQPGIEALSTRLLKLMRKGVQARQNLMLLRIARILGIRLVWNMICGFPNDEITAYQETMALLPLIVHLQPPCGLWHLSIDRFSPYFFDPSAHHVANVRPLPVYDDFLPPGSNTHRIAYHFVADYPSETHKYIGLVRELSTQTRLWTKRWSQPYKKRPELKVCRLNERYVLVDTRELPGAEELRYIDDSEARVLMNSKPYGHSPQEDEAVGRQLAVVVDNWFVPLPVGNQELFCELTADGARHGNE